MLSQVLAQPPSLGPCTTLCSGAQNRLDLKHRKQKNRNSRPGSTSLKLSTDLWTNAVNHEEPWYAQLRSARRALSW